MRDGTAKLFFTREGTGKLWDMKSGTKRNKAGQNGNSSFDFEFLFRASISSFYFEFPFRVLILSFDFEACSVLPRIKTLRSIFRI